MSFYVIWSEIMHKYSLSRSFARDLTRLILPCVSHVCNLYHRWKTNLCLTVELDKWGTNNGLYRYPCFRSFQALHETFVFDIFAAPGIWTACSLFAGVWQAMLRGGERCGGGCELVPGTGGEPDSVQHTRQHLPTIYQQPPAPWQPDPGALDK